LREYDFLNRAAEQCGDVTGKCSRQSAVEPSLDGACIADEAQQRSEEQNERKEREEGGVRHLASVDRDLVLADLLPRRLQDGGDVVTSDHHWNGGVCRTFAAHAACLR